jgi:hypothetical protein
MVPHHHASQFLPKIKDDFSLLVSVMGESVMGHGIGGKDIPIKMA